MKYDLIVVSKSINEQIKAITQRCINTARADLQNHEDINVILIETSGKMIKYEGVNDYIIYDRAEFCYNHALNQGIKRAKNEIFILANNDIVFAPGWSIIGDLMVYNGFDSASALSEDYRQRHFEKGNFVYEGYDIGSYLTGWCIFVTRKAMDKIGDLDERYAFWYSDNAYADQLMDKQLRHGLFCNIFVYHITNVTIRTLTARKQRELTYDLIRKYKVTKRLYAKTKGNN